MTLASIDKTSKKFILHGIEQPDGDIVRVQSGLICVKVAGYDYWAAIDQRSYCPAEYQIWKVNEVQQSSDENILDLRVERLMNFDVRTKKSDYGTGLHRLEDY